MKKPNTVKRRTQDAADIADAEKLLADPKQKPKRFLTGKVIDDMSAAVRAKLIRALAHSYTLVLEPLDEGGFLGSSIEMPNVMADGKTADRCVKAVRQALIAGITYLIETGKEPPAPHRETRERDLKTMRANAKKPQRFGLLPKRA